jgi:hypothetical protein
VVVGGESPKDANKGSESCPYVIAFLPGPGILIAEHRPS